MGHFYSAEHDQQSDTWRGWAQLGGRETGRGQIVRTPQTFRTRREALAAIKAQHPDERQSKQCQDCGRSIAGDFAADRGPGTRVLCWTCRNA